MSETQKQALLRFVMVTLAAAVSAALLNIGPLTDVITDPTIRAVATIALTGILQGLLKLLGGPTMQIPSDVAAASPGTTSSPRWWSV